ncbi:CsgE family curli-type amyloid fiber assembly protein [Ascidiimonas sp. W6]|uniref:CsgE family curli-type amyloid fiber assembly protein n=1 Tax=Ascidiimonas meishanensis TaxID=3128903 RepID=UPI0030ECF685
MKLFLCFLSFTFISVSTYAQKNSDGIIAFLKVDDNDGVFAIQALVKNDSTLFKSLKYELAVIKSKLESKEKPKRIATQGNFSINPSEVKVLEQTFVEFEKEEDKIIVLLLLYEGEKIITTDRKVFLNTKSQNKPVVDDGIEIKGLVIDNVVSKVGKDFYDLFYRQYSLRNIKSGSLVTIEEQLGIGIGTRIVVKVDEDIVFEGFARPNEEYLEQMANAVVGKVLKYLEQKKKQKEYINQY